MKPMLGTKKKQRSVCRLLAGIVLAFFILICITVPTQAHAPGDPPPVDFNLPEITIIDGGKEVKISLADMAHYYGQQTSGGSTVYADIACSYRAMQTGIKQVWGKEIPSRDDIIIISALPSHCSVLCFQYLTGTGQGMDTVKGKGEFRLQLPDGRIVEDYSFEQLRKLARDITLDNYEFTFISKATNKSFTLKVNGDIFPAGYFELRHKIAYGNNAEIKGKDFQSFAHQQVKLSEHFVTHECWEIFADIEQPFPLLEGGFTIAVLLFMVGGAIYRSVAYKLG